VVAAVTLDPRRAVRCTELGDSKALSAPVREAAYQQILEAALAWHAVVIPSADIDRLGLHVCNVAGMRRALAGLAPRPVYVLTDGFPVRGLAVPALAMWKGDQVAACVAAASIIAKVTRDRIMRGLHAEYPQYGFARHKGYSTRGHMRALNDHGPCPEHRRSFANVMGAGGGPAELPPDLDAPLPPGLDPELGPSLDPEPGPGLDPELAAGLEPALPPGASLPSDERAEVLLTYRSG
jgi:ribonuclease HII